MLLKRPRSSDAAERPKFTGDPDEFRLTLVQHLEELRDRIIRSLLILGAAWLVGWLTFTPVYSYFNQMVNAAIQPVLRSRPGVEYREVLQNATDAFLLKLHLSFLIGLGLAFPFLLLQLWGFVEPGLKPSESKPVRKIVPFVVLLFAIGVGFAWLILPQCLAWFASYVLEFPGVSLYQNAGTMVFFVLKLLIAFGFAFQLPLIVWVLGAMNLLSADTLLKYWRQAATAIFVLAMVVTPSQDPATMLAMAIPLSLLFIISVYAVKFMQRRRRPAAEVEPGAE